MTYCLGLLLDEGLVIIADTRTNAGVDNFSSYQKLHCIARADDREIFIASAGNLSASQAAVGMLTEGGLSPQLNEAGSMFEVAQLVGKSLRQANQELVEAVAPKIKGASCLLLGGRLGGGEPRLFLIYEEGNFIECKRDAPFLQIGETKYGRPILDRVMKRTTPLARAVKIGLLSFDSAMRSNLSVSRPLDMVVMPGNAAEPTLIKRIEDDDVYFNELSARWSELLGEATMVIPDPQFMAPTAREEPERVVRLTQPSQAAG